MSTQKYEVNKVVRRVYSDITAKLTPADYCSWWITDVNHVAFTKALA